MKNTIFEQAALEASAGLKELDAQAEQLEARKEGLLASRDLLETVGHQLFAVMSMFSGAARAHTAEVVDIAHASEPVHEDAPAFEEPVPVSYAEAHQEYDAHQEQMEEHAPVEETASAAEGTEDAPAPEPPTFAELLSQSKPYSLRNDGWPAATPVTSRTLRSLL